MNCDKTTESGSEIPCEDNTEVLLKKYDSRKRQKTDDIFAMQTVICILIAAGLLILNIVQPELCGELYGRLCELTEDENEVMPNIIDVVIRLCTG
ncbi:MAG: hypothetical protein E7497_04150 [Ruminococcus sp.]|nr:hypothetical protein [Ruminococcus sp.]